MDNSPIIIDLFLTNLRFVSSFGDSYFLLSTFVLVLSALFIFDKHKREMLIILLSFITYPVSIVLKLIFKVMRPETGIERYLNNPLDFYSFPSSHVMFYTVFFGYILFLCIRMKHESKLLRTISASVSTYLIITIGISRYFLGFHWLRDIYGGYFIGLILLVLLIYVDLKLKKFKTDDNTDFLRTKKKKTLVQK